MPLDVKECLAIFDRMLVCCKITKLWEVNYKIVARILVSPLVVASVRLKPNLKWCSWCGERGLIDHILLQCPETLWVHHWVQENTPLNVLVTERDWILGTEDHCLNQIIWVVNFGIYKSHLEAMDGPLFSMLEQVQRELL